MVPPLELEKWVSYRSNKVLTIDSDIIIALIAWQPVWWKSRGKNVENGSHENR
jgi:hypothetical protein